MLNNEIYAGVTYYGKTRTKTKGGKVTVIAKLPKEEWIKIPVPHLAVIVRATFDAVETRKRRNIQLQLRNSRRKYLMSGHFRCQCGQVMVGSNREGYLRYQCSTHWKSPGKKQCSTHNHSSVCHKVDTLVWDWLYNLLTDEQALEDGLAKMVEMNRDNTGTKRKRLDTLEKLITKQERSIEHLVNELSDGDYNDKFTRNIFKDKISENTRLIKELQKEKDQLEIELAQVVLSEEFTQEIKSMAAQIRSKLSGATFDGKRAVMDKLNVKVIFRVEDGKRWLDLTCSLSSGRLSRLILEPCIPFQRQPQPLIQRDPRPVAELFLGQRQVRTHP
jgi:hypothetical protein